MNKANRILFDVLCIIAIIIFPMFILEMIGICDIARRLEHEQSKT